MTQEQSTTNGNRASVDDLQAYPLLTDSDSGARAASAAGAASRSNTRQAVEQNLRSLLAWRPKADDPKGFLASLNQAFEVTDVDGHTEWRWNPRSYAIQADMGAVTGAQASIHARARSALDQSLPLLEGLYPLLAVADPQDVEAARAMVRNALTELVEELGIVGGPRLQRIDGYFLSLLGRLSVAVRGNRQDNPDRLINPELVGGLLGLMRERFGLERAQVNTIDEEQNLTNYLILVDHTIALQRSWATYRHYFDRDGIDVFLGTQLVLLSRALNVIAESVYEVEAAMDSVYLDAAERQITRLPLERNQFQLTIAELLGWTYSVASDEGLRLINDAGKDGVITLAPILEQLHLLVQEMVELAQRDGIKLLQSNSQIAVPPFHTPRVRVVLKGLERSLFEAARLSKQLRRQPDTTLFTVQPNHAMQGEVVRISIEGEALPENPHVHLNRAGPSNKRIDGDRVTNVRLISSNEIRATLDLADAETGTWTVVVTGSDDLAYALHNAFTVEDPPLGRKLDPIITTIDPSLGFVGQSLTVNIIGDGFRHDMTSSQFGEAITVRRTAVLSTTHLQVDLQIAAGAHSGPRDVTVTVGSATPVTRTAGFTVYDVPSQGPALTALEPNQGEVGTADLVVEVLGSNISDTATLTIEGSTVQVKQFLKLRRQWVAILDLTSANAGSYDVVVRNADGKQARLPAHFTVTSASGSSGSAGEALIVGRALLHNTTPKGQVRVKGTIARADFGTTFTTPPNPGIDNVTLELNREPHASVDLSQAIVVEKIDAGGATRVDVKITKQGNTISLQKPANFDPGTYRVSARKDKLTPAHGRPMDADAEMTFTIP